MDKLDEKLKQIFSEDLNISRDFDYVFNKDILDKRKQNKKIHISKLKLASVMCMFVFLITGTVFSKEIIKNIFNLDKEIDYAIINGYYAENVTEFKNIEVALKRTDDTFLKSTFARTKIEDFIMDDHNLNFSLVLEIGDNFFDNYKANELLHYELCDFVITDENKKILYCNSKNFFEKYCNENKLDYDWEKFNENYINSGINYSIENIDKDNGKIKLICNLYSNLYPKSKELNISFNKLKLYDDEKSMLIEGNWNLDIRVPEKSYNREGTTYKTIKCSNKDFNVKNILVTETYTEIEIEGKTVPKPISPEEKFIKEWRENGKSIDELRENIIEFEKTDEYKNWWNNVNIFNTDYDNLSYIENEYGDKYYQSLSPSNTNYEEYQDDGSFYVKRMLTLTKYDASNILKFYIKYRNEWVEIEFQKQ